MTPEEHNSRVEHLCHQIHKMLEGEHRNTTTAVLSGVLALHLSQSYGTYATETLDAEYVPSIHALIRYHQQGKLGNQ